MSVTSSCNPPAYPRRGLQQILLKSTPIVKCPGRLGSFRGRHSHCRGNKKLEVLVARLGVPCNKLITLGSISDYAQSRYRGFFTTVVESRATSFGGSTM